MSKHILYSIAFAMSVSLFTLLFIQSVWIRNAFELSELNFEADVEKAANAFALELEKNEINTQFQAQKRRTTLLNRIDSLNQSMENLQIQNPDVLFEENMQGILATVNEETGLIVQEDTVAASEEETEEAEEAENAGESPIIEVAPPANLQKKSVRNIRRIYTQMKAQRDEYLHKTRLMDELLQEIAGFQNTKPFTSRVNPYAIDSLFTKQLLKKNVQIRCEWGIYSTLHNKLIVQKTGRYKSELLKSSFVYKLFPSDSEQNAHYLLVYFPDMKQVIFSRVFTLLFLSFLLVISIICVYTYTLYKMYQNRKLSEIKTDFINNMSHEIKTPISTIALVCEALEDSDMEKNPENLKNFTNLIKQENERLKTLSKHIIDISKLERGQLLMNKKPIHLHEALETAIQNLDFQVKHKNGRIITRFNADNDEINGDFVHIVNVFTNLIDNANKYCNTTPLIEISTENVSKWIHIQFKDNGIGMHKSQIKKIFDTLYRIPTGNIHNVKGYGLGLNYAKSVIINHQGHISVESQPKTGSVFTIKLLTIPPNLSTIIYEK